MGVREEVVAALKSGRSPGEIAGERGVTLSTVLGYLDQMVGRGRIRRSDILFSVPVDKRTAIAEKLKDGHSHNAAAVVARLARSGHSVDEDDVEVMLRYGDARHALGDIYEDIRLIEVGLHQLVRRALEKEHGSGELGWWRQGVPSRIRVKCQQRREEDEIETPPDPYCYTDLLDLREILKSKWNILSQHLPAQVAKDKNPLLDDLIRLNHIRRLVMHPVRGGEPTGDDFDFLHSLKERFGFGK
jgi:hypothetical protein